MGTLFQAQCTGCDYHVTLHVGGGFMDCQREIALTALAPDVREQADEMCPGFLSINRRAAQCHNCEAIYALPVVGGVDSDGAPHTYYGNCPNCDIKGNENDVLYDDQRPPCPDCGADVMLYKSGMWD